MPIRRLLLPVLLLATSTSLLVVGVVAYHLGVRSARVRLGSLVVGKADDLLARHDADFALFEALSRERLGGDEVHDRDISTSPGTIKIMDVHYRHSRTERILLYRRLGPDKKLETSDDQLIIVAKVEESDNEGLLGDELPQFPSALEGRWTVLRDGPEYLIVRNEGPVLGNKPAK